MTARLHFVARTFGVIAFAVIAAAVASSSVLAQDVLDRTEITDSAYFWTPDVAPEGPLLIVVGLAEQRANVYRNGVRIGSSLVSTGKPGHETPTGVFTILQKRREHYSNLYDNAPMPFMQRLTWDGIAMHAGHLPGYPASHGCVRLPRGFSEVLFQATRRGMTVVVAASLATPVQRATSPFSGGPAPAAIPAADAWSWTPERSLTGPLTMVLSTHDQRLVVWRNGVEIGSAAVHLPATDRTGTRAYTLQAERGPGASLLVPDAPELQWTEVAIGLPRHTPGAELRQRAGGGQLNVPAEFARLVYAQLTPGTTVLVTDEAIEAVSTQGITVLEGELDD